MQSYEPMDKKTDGNGTHEPKDKTEDVSGSTEGAYDKKVRNKYINMEGTWENI